MRTPAADRALRVLRLLLSPLYSGALAPEHHADLRKSALTDETISMHRLMSVPPDLFEPLVGFRRPLRVRSLMLIPYPDPAGGWMDHVRVKVFPPIRSRDGSTIKYLGPSGWAPRLYFPLGTLRAVLDGAAPVWVFEGGKKSLAAAQLGLPAIGFEGVEAWHVKQARDLLPDFDVVPFAGQLVELVPDGDGQTNPNVRRGVERFAGALRARGARVRLVKLPVMARDAA